MEKVDFIIPKVDYTMDSGMQIKCKGKELSITAVERLLMKVIGWLINSRDSEFSTTNTQVNLINA